MNVYLSSTHIDTLCKLKEIAAKHNCVISCGFQTDSDDCFDTNIFEANDVAPEIVKTLETMYENNDFNDYKRNCEQTYFTLYEKVSGDIAQAHTMYYNEESLEFYIKDYISLVCSYVDNNENQINAFEDFAQEMSVNNDSTCPFFNFSYCPTIIDGFGLEHVEDERVYRQGMALKYFADLVCDYLKEPRIVATY